MVAARCHHISKTNHHDLQAEQFKIIREAYADVKERLTELRPQLEQLVEELYQKDELSGDEVKAILSGPGIQEKLCTGEAYNSRQLEMQAIRDQADSWSSGEDEGSGGSSRGGAGSSR